MCTVISLRGFSRNPGIKEQSVHENLPLHGFAKFYEPENQIRKKGIVRSFPFSLFAVCTVENRKHYIFCLDVKMIVKVLYINVLLDSFSKLFGPQYRIRKKEILIYFLFPYSQFVWLRFGNLHH